VCIVGCASVAEQINDKEIVQTEDKVKEKTVTKERTVERTRELLDKLDKIPMAPDPVDTQVEQLGKFVEKKIIQNVVKEGGENLLDFKNGLSFTGMSVLRIREERSTAQKTRVIITKDGVKTDKTGEKSFTLTNHPNRVHIGLYSGERNAQLAWNMTGDGGGVERVPSIDIETQVIDGLVHITKIIKVVKLISKGRRLNDVPRHEWYDRINMEGEDGITFGVMGGGTF